jgi:hypothetical protein
MRKLILLVLFVAFFPGCDNADYDEVNKIGIVGVAEILKVEDTKTTINDNPRVDLTIKVYSKDREPFETMITRTVSRVDIPRRGDLRAVKFDPKDNSKVILLFEEDANNVKKELDEIAANIKK